MDQRTERYLRSLGQTLKGRPAVNLAEVQQAYQARLAKQVEEARKSQKQAQVRR